MSISALKPRDLNDWDPALATVVEDMNGAPLNVHRQIANQPGLLEALWPFRNYVVSGGALEPRQRELIILRVAHLTRTAYEWASHVVRGQAAGLTVDEIRRVPVGPDHADWTDSDALLLRAVDECAANQRIAPETLEALGGHFTPQQVLDLMAIQTLYVLLGFVINTWDVALDDFVDVPEDLHLAALA